MKYSKERHIVFQEADVTEILVEYLKRSGEKDIPAVDEIEFSYDEFKHGNEITLMFDDVEIVEEAKVFVEDEVKVFVEDVEDVINVPIKTHQWPFTKAWWEKSMYQ